MFNFFDTVFPIFFLAMFSTILGFILVTAFRSLREWDRNNHSPRLTVDALIVSKRMSVSHSSGGQNHMTTSHTTYYVTFQVPSGDRMELQVPASQYGYLVETDRGQLTFQGTRFLSFERG